MCIAPGHPVASDPEPLDPLSQWHAAAARLQAIEQARSRLPSLNTRIRDALVKGIYPRELVQARNLLLAASEIASDSLDDAEHALLMASRGETCISD